MELPVCRWRGAPLPGGRFRCASPKIIARGGVTADHCARCFCKDHPPPPGRPAPVPTPPAPAPARSLECFHLGDVVDKLGAKCGLCWVRECDKHGRCTLARPHEGLPVCRTCPDYTSDPPPAIKRNLVMHLYPFAPGGPAWRRSVAQLKARWPLFNGRKVVAVAEGPLTEDFAAVRAAFDDPSVEYLHVTNSRTIGEGASFARLLDAVQSDSPTEFTFYCHAKGVRRPRNPGVTCHAWGDVMFETCLDYPALVEADLARFAMTGSFKKIGFSFDGNGWHYSGTFFWMNHARVFARNWREVPQYWGGVEAWPGVHFRAEETGRLFLEGKAENLELYSRDYLTERVLPALRLWRAENAARRVAPAPVDRPAWVLPTE